QEGKVGQIAPQVYRLRIQRVVFGRAIFGPTQQRRHSNHASLAGGADQMISRTDLNPLSAEAVALLKDAPLPKRAFNILYWMSPKRQIEAAQLMVSTGNFSRSFLQALLVASKPEDRVMWGAKPMRGLSSEQAIKMQQELECLLKDSGEAAGYSDDMMSLVVV